MMGRSGVGRTRMAAASCRGLLSGLPLSTLLLLLAAIGTTSGHEHSTSHIQEGHTVSMDPIDTTLWVHILIQISAWGVIFPIGMVLGMTKNRWHVPVQALGTTLTFLGYALGHLHGGRQFAPNNVHAKSSGPLMFMLLSQIVMGIYLRLHLEKGFNGKVRGWVKVGHGVLGKAMPVLAWVQMLFGGITALGFCQDDHLGQCLAHFIMGSAFIAYAMVLTILLMVGQLWLRRTGRSQEFYDNAVIAVWGCFNTFTEHRWGQNWTAKDWQHTTMGIVWWCAGLAGMWLSKDRRGRPQRNFMPGFVLFITGWAMSAHPQALMISAETHKMFGYTLMAAGLTRVIEVSIVLRGHPGVSEHGQDTSPFQYIPIFLLYASGFLFMGATEEQMELVDASPMDHVAYILILYSLASLLFLFTMMLVNLYESQAAPAVPAKDMVTGRSGPRGPRNVQMREAQEFELEGLMTDDEEDERQRCPDGGESGLTSPSTVGKNSDGVAH